MLKKVRTGLKLIDQSCSSIIKYD